MAQVRLVTQASTPDAQVGTYENRVPSYETSGTWLWEYFRPVPAQNSILVWADGTVEERQVPKNSETKKAEVFIPGGHQFVTDEGSFAHSSLVAAGYEFEAV
jgi:hypothetical protein